MAEAVGGSDAPRANMDRVLEEELRASLVDGYLPCPVAFQIARKLEVSRRQVGDMANRMKVRITSCQLGCFQVEKATHDDLIGRQVNETLAAEIEVSRVDGKLPCAVAFDVAKKLKVTPKEVGDAATMQKAKISSCQLGCF
jgi:hypothetical protein